MGSFVTGTFSLKLSIRVEPPDSGVHATKLSKIYSTLPFAISPTVLNKKVFASGSVLPAPNAPRVEYRKNLKMPTFSLLPSMSPYSIDFNNDVLVSRP